MFDRAVQLYYSSIILNIHQNGWNGHQQLFELGHYIWDTWLLGWNSVLRWTECFNSCCTLHLSSWMKLYVGQSALDWFLGWNSILCWKLCVTLGRVLQPPQDDSPYCTWIIPLCYTSIILNWKIIMKLHFDQLINNLLGIVWLSLVRPFEPSFAFHVRRGESRRGEADQVFVQCLENFGSQGKIWFDLVIFTNWDFSLAPHQHL